MSSKPCLASRATTCSSIGLFASGIIGFGLVAGERP
jgi:hypothetical protein